MFTDSSGRLILPEGAKLAWVFLLKELRESWKQEFRSNLTSWTSRPLEWSGTGNRIIRRLEKKAGMKSRSERQLWLEPHGKLFYSCSSPSQMLHKIGIGKVKRVFCLCEVIQGEEKQKLILKNWKQLFLMKWENKIHCKAENNYNFSWTV